MKKSSSRFSNTNLVIREHDVHLDSHGQSISIFLVLNNIWLHESVNSVLQKVRELFLISLSLILYSNCRCSWIPLDLVMLRIF